MNQVMTTQLQLTTTLAGNYSHASEIASSQSIETTTRWPATNRWIQHNGVNSAGSTWDTMSTTEAPNTDPGKYNWPVLILGLLVATGIVGNLLVCVAVKSNDKLQSMFFYLVMSLAVSDMLNALLVMSVALLQSLVDHFPLPHAVCITWQLLDVVFTTSSIVHICALLLDCRSSMICPLKYKMQHTKGYILVKILSTWFVILIFSAGSVVAFFVVKVDRALQFKGCGANSLAHALASSVLSFAIPAFVALILYAVTSRTLTIQTLTARKFQREAQAAKRQILNTTAKKYLATTNVDSESEDTIEETQNEHKSVPNGDVPAIKMGKSQLNGPTLMITDITGDLGSTDNLCHSFDQDSTDCNGLDNPAFTKNTEDESLADSLRRGPGLLKENNVTEENEDRESKDCPKHKSILHKSKAVEEISTDVNSDQNIDVDQVSIKEQNGTTNTEEGAKAGHTGILSNGTVPKKRRSVRIRCKDGKIVEPGESDPDSIKRKSPYRSRRHKLSKITESVSTYLQNTPLDETQKTAEYIAQIRHRQSLRLSLRAHQCHLKLRILGTMYFSFVFFCLPYFVIFVILGVCQTCKESISDHIIIVFQWIAYAASVLNPLFYHCLHPDIAESFTSNPLCACCDRCEF